MLACICAEIIYWSKNRTWAEISELKEHVHCKYNFHASNFFWWKFILLWWPKWFKFLLAWFKTSTWKTSSIGRKETVLWLLRMPFLFLLTSPCLYVHQAELKKKNQFFSLSKTPMVLKHLISYGSQHIIISDTLLSLDMCFFIYGVQWKMFCLLKSEKC